MAAVPFFLDFCGLQAMTQPPSNLTSCPVANLARSLERVPAAAEMSAGRLRRLTKFLPIAGRRSIIGCHTLDVSIDACLI